MRKFLTSILVLALIISSFAGCASEIQGTSSTPDTQKSSEDQTAQLSGKLTLNGSTSMAKVCQALSEVFHEKYPNVTVEKSGTGSGDAAKAVNSGTALIGDLSRQMKSEENPDNYEIVPIAIDGIAIAVNKDNSVSGLTTQQITDIFTGKITNWKEIGGEDEKITVLGREAASGTRDGFESIFNCKEKCKYATELSSTGEVVTKVGNDKSGIGYISLDSVNPSVKALKVDDIEANEENIVSGEYKAQRTFIEIYKKGSDNELIKAWFEFVNSDEGKKVIKDAGLVNVK